MWKNVEKLYTFKSCICFIKKTNNNLKDCSHFQSQYPKMIILAFLASQIIFFGISNPSVTETERYRPMRYLSGECARSVVHVFEQVCPGFKWITPHYPQLLFRISWEMERKSDVVFC